MGGYRRRVGFTCGNCGTAKDGEPYGRLRYERATFEFCSMVCQHRGIAAQERSGFFYAHPLRYDPPSEAPDRMRRSRG